MLNLNTKDGKTRCLKAKGKEALKKRTIRGQLKKKFLNNTIRIEKEEKPNHTAGTINVNEKTVEIG